MKINIEALLDVAHLQNSYVQAIDDDKLESWPNFFTDQCLYKLSPRENYDENLPACLIMCDSKAMLEDRIVSYRNANIYNCHFTRHIVGMPRITASNGETISAETSYAIFQTQLNGETSVFQVGRYLDTIVNDHGQLKFKEKICVFDTYRVHRLLATPV
ncbi:aromatic-ring-hydroxylating dioxygenase beta subunit [Methylocella silvestris BL2]|uniref:Aromatic-ring-hydroxylating dioxygenase beta subunit n=1 Tax=Methylocella silvestris (strain DSM 15510 / CIP 108128 / LMG 27833 / NCIMB 13906 / BL2) TaxID=395965 RepID=B8ESU3_METSB|nr:aromatic-ring-hydroxylating dioxygenase subunit beta [Methylocella silvestris]ACK50428.1 aromatic-ring-hydroxylating dioxygenase beta subunit [Methylocella silvestris BL2]